MRLSRHLRQAAWPAIATLLHVLFALVVWIVPHRQPTAPAASATKPAEAVAEVEVGVADEPAASAPPESPRTPEEAVASATKPAPTVAAVGRVAKPEPLDDVIETPAPTPEASAVAGARSGAVASEPDGDRRAIQLTVRRPEDIGIGGQNQFLPKSQAAVEDAEARRAVNRAMKDPARERERDLGLGPEGPVLTALAESTARSVAPVKGRAVFVATTNAAGEVATIELADTEGSRAGWDDARKLALAALAGKKLRLPANTSRAVMRIEVTSAWKMPSGQDPGMNLSLFHIPITKGEGKDSPKMSILDPIPKFHVEYLEIGGPGGAKIPLVSIQIDLFTTNADPSNIGARPRRIVHTHAIDTQLM